MQVKLWDKKGFPVPSPKVERKWRSTFYPPLQLLKQQHRTEPGILSYSTWMCKQTHPECEPSMEMFLKPAALPHASLPTFWEQVNIHHTEQTGPAVRLCQVSQVQPSHPCPLQETEQAVYDQVTEQCGVPLGYLHTWGHFTKRPS